MGTTGAGKTTAISQLVERITHAYPHACLYVLDTKRASEDGLSYFGPVHSGIDAPDVLHVPGSHQVWQPPINDGKQIDKWFMRILRAGKPAIVWVNEVRYIIDERTKRYPMGYALMLSQGRAHHIMVISETQRVAHIPADVLGMTTHILRFRLQNDFDRRRIDNEMERERKDIGKEPKDEYGFYYKRMGRRTIWYYPDWEYFVGRKDHVES